MLKTPGKCHQNDDIQMLTPKLGADVLVLASPLYIWAVNGQMKNLMDRMVPLLPPNKGRVILVSSCGFWGLENFDPLLFHIKAICHNIDRVFAGALLRPHAVYLKMMLEAGAQVQDIPAAAQEAGRQLVVDQTINPKTLSIVSRELVSLEAWNDRVKQRFGPTADSSQ
jgi:NAD(P)H-dependent FMN reductase